MSLRKAGIAVKLFLRDDDPPCPGLHPSSDLPDAVANHICVYDRIRGDLDKADPRLAPQAELFIGIQDPSTHPEMAEDIDATLVGLVQDVSAAMQLDGGRWNEPE